MATDWSLVAAFASAVAGVGSAVAGLGAWGAATRSASSAKDSADAANKLTELEGDRRHAELTPVFDFRLDEGTEHGGTHGELSIQLTGPVGLDYLDIVTIEILDEAWKKHWNANNLPRNVTEEEAANFVWGPWEFNQGASEQVISNRKTRPRSYVRVTGENWERLSLRRTKPGHWMSDSTDDAAWQRLIAGPIRLLITCNREPLPEWYLLYEISPGLNSNLER